MVEVPVNLFDELQKGCPCDSKALKSLYFSLKSQPQTLKSLLSCYIHVLNSLKDFRNPNQRTHADIYLKLLERLIAFIFEREREGEKLSSFAVDLARKIVDFFSLSFETTFCLIQIFSCRAILDVLTQIEKFMRLEEFIDLDMLNRLFTIGLYLLFQKSSVRRQGIELASLISKLAPKFPQIYPQIRIFNRELLQIFASDSAKDLRRLSLRHLQLTPELIQDFLHRVRDPDPDLVELLFRKLQLERILIANLDSREVLGLLHAGLYSRVKPVQIAFTDYIQGNYTYFAQEETQKDWKTSRQQLLDFLKLFPLKESLQCPRVYRLLEDFFEAFIEETSNRNQGKGICFEFAENLGRGQKMGSEEMFFLKILIKKAKKSKWQRLLEIIEDGFPSLFEVVPWVKEFLEKGSLLGVFEALQLIEFQINWEENGKAAMIDLIRELALDVTGLKGESNKTCEDLEDFLEIKGEPLETQRLLLKAEDPAIITGINDLIYCLLTILRQLLANNDLFIISVMEIISEVKSNFDGETVAYAKSLEKQADSNGLLLERLRHDISRKPGINELRALKLEETRVSRKLMEIQKERKYIETLMLDTRIRSLTLLIALLKITPINLKHPGNSSLLGTFIAPNMVHSNPKIKELAIQALGLYVSLDQAICSEYFPVFLQIAGEQELAVRILALRSITDLMQLYTLEDQIKMPAIEMFGNLIFSSETIIQRLAIEAVAKLLFNAEFKEAIALNLLASLAFVWLECDCEPNIEGFVSQFLSLFFRNFTFKSARNLELFSKSFSLLLKSFLIFYRERIRIDTRFSRFQLQNTGFLTSFLKVGLYLLKSMERPEDFPSKLTPQERFFCFLCRHFAFAGNDIQVLDVFEKALTHFNFERTFENQIKCFFLKDFLNRLLFISPDLKKKKGLFALRDKFAEKTKEFKATEQEYELLKSWEAELDDSSIESGVKTLFQQLKDLKILSFSGRLILSKYHLKPLS